MKPALLDTSVLIALIDPTHEFHDAAHHWFHLNRRYGWATCPITENGCLRILGKPGYPYPGVTVNDVCRMLSRLRESADHHFWKDSVSLLDPSRFDLSEAFPKHLTDLYLLGIALAERGRLATFDRGIRWESVAGASAEAVAIIAG